jgi:MFS family permease
LRSNLASRPFASDASCAGVYKKIAWRLMPLLMACFVIAQLTRFNISFAKLTFSDDIGISDAMFGVAVSLFYIGYLSFQLPSSMLLSQLGARTFLSCIILAWGTVGATMMLVREAGDLYLLRFLLGAAQAGFFPGIIFFLSTWFPDRLRGRINSLFTSAIPLASIVGGPLAAWIMGSLDDVRGLHGWQWLFLLEGSAAIVLGITVSVFLTNDPVSAKWLKEAEKNALLSDRQAPGGARAKHAVGSNGGALRDPKVWLMGVIYFGYFCALNALVLWGPSVLAMAGARGIVSVGWISGLSALVSSLGMLAIGMSSDRLNERRWHVGLCGSVAAACLLLLPLAADSVVATAALLIVTATGLYAILGLFWTIPGAYLERNSAARGFALINMLGVCGGVVSPVLVGWLKSQTGSLHIGMAAIAILLATSMIGLLVSTAAGPKPQH